MLEDLNTVARLREEIEHLRAGEEDGATQEAFPTPGQLLRQIHDDDLATRMRRMENLLAIAEAGHSCAMNLHEANLHELRQKTMDSWGILARIARMCSDPDRDGLLHVSEVVELLPDGLIRG